MKKLLVLLMLVLIAVPCYAASKLASDNGYLGNDDWIIRNDGDIVPNSTSSTITIGTTELDGTCERSINFTPGEFTLEGYDIDESTTPGLEKDNNATAIVWADGEQSPAQVTFKVPADYSSGGAFRLLCDESGDTTRSQVDFNVYVNSDGATWDTSASNQTPVALTELAGTAEQVTLSVATDFASLAAGNFVTLNVWRDNVATGTNDLELYYADFYYTATTE